MKKLIFIGNRLNVIEQLEHWPELQLVRVYVQEDSPLHRNLAAIKLPAGIEARIFQVRHKADIITEIAATEFDILISNGCPFILPIADMHKDHRLFFNVHPTVLPDLKGKTPLNGVFLLHQPYIGATMHHIDSGIDTGSIVAQVKTPVTPDLDQGLVYKISFDLESTVFNEGMEKLVTTDYTYQGEPQVGEGSYFNRTAVLQTIDLQTDTSAIIVDKVKSFGIKGQGSNLTLRNAIYKVFAAECIVNQYLNEAYSSVPVGEIAFEYDDKFILSTKDGLIKVGDFEIIQSDDIPGQKS